jgi:colanic acid biosynthesis glycosyl transferase WcaI
MDSKKVLIVSQHFPPDKSGNASRVYDLSKNLVNLGLQVIVYSPFPSFPHGSFPRVNKLRTSQSVDGISNFKTWNWQPRAPNPRFISRALYYLVFPCLATVRALINSKHYDYIITTAPPIFTGIPGYFLKKITGKKWLFDVRDLWIDASASLDFIKKEGLLYKMARRYEQTCYSTCDEVLVTSESIKKAIMDIYKIPEEKFHIIPNGVDTSVYKPLKEKKKQIIYAGNIGFAQDLEKVILAVKKVNEVQKNDPFNFYLVGDGDIRHELERFTRENHVEDHVFFSGMVSREKVPELIGESLIGVAPLKNLETLEYALPTKCYEYMACGVPFIGTGNGQIKMLAHESKAGLIAENNINSISEKILFLSQHPESAEEMGTQGRAFVTKYYDRRNIAKRLFSVIIS